MMRSVFTAAIVVLVGILVACGGAGEQSVAETAPPPASEATADLHPSILPRPFTAEQIRDEWIVGLTMTLRRTTPEGSSVERWTVVTADADVTSAVAERNVTGHTAFWVRERWLPARAGVERAIRSS